MKHSVLNRLRDLRRRGEKTLRARGNGNSVFQNKRADVQTQEHYGCTQQGLHRFKPEGPRPERENWTQSSTLTKKLPAVGTCQQRKNPVFSNGVSLGLSTTPQGRPHTQEQLANTKRPQW